MRRGEASVYVPGGLGKPALLAPRPQPSRPGPGCSVPAHGRSPWTALPSNQPVAFGGQVSSLPITTPTPVSALVAVSTSQL